MWKYLFIIIKENAIRNAIHEIQSALFWKSKQHPIQENYMVVYKHEDGIQDIKQLVQLIPPSSSENPKKRKLAHLYQLAIKSDIEHIPNHFNQVIRHYQTWKQNVSIAKKEWNQEKKDRSFSELGSRLKSNMQELLQLMVHLQLELDNGPSFLKNTIYKPIPGHLDDYVALHLLAGNSMIIEKMNELIEKLQFSCHFKIERSLADNTTHLSLHNSFTLSDDEWKNIIHQIHPNLCMDNFLDLKEQTRFLIESRIIQKSYLPL